MKAAAFTEPGGPEVLRAMDVPDPQAGPGQVRVRVRAAGVQPFDAAVRAGWEPPYATGLTWPRIPGNEFAGVVDQVGDGAAWSVGTAAVQLARLWGASVIGTASEANQDYVRSLGATPVVYGDGLEDRLRALSPGGVHAVLDGAGGVALDLSLALLKERRRVVTLVDHDRAESLGVQLVRGQRSADRLAELARLYDRGELSFLVRRTYRLGEAADAHREIETGHGRGKVVLTV